MLLKISEMQDVKPLEYRQPWSSFCRAALLSWTWIKRAIEAVDNFLTEQSYPFAAAGRTGTWAFRRYRRSLGVQMVQAGSKMLGKKFAVLKIKDLAFS